MLRRTFLIPLLSFSVTGLFFLLYGLFVLPESRQALVFQYGQLQRILHTPGLYFYVPFVQDVVEFDARMLNFDVSDIEVTLGDQKRIVVNTFTRYHIQDPKVFYQTVGNERGAKERLAALVPGFLRGTLSETSLRDLLSHRRAQVMKHIQDNLNRAAQHLGVEILEVRILGTNFPHSNEQAVFERMISHCQREAQNIRALGRERAQITRAKADLDSQKLIFQAHKQRKILEGKAQSEVNTLYQTLYTNHKDFVLFYLKLQSCQRALEAKKTRWVLSLNSPYLNILNKGK